MIIAISLLILVFFAISLIIQCKKAIESANYILDIVKKEVITFDRTSRRVIDIAQKLSLPLVIISNILRSKSKKKGGK
ncbi:MAG: hypothetical protein LBQ37_03045 [Elusimicrobiota bacterium]|nr:hypothetical protein [Elusimicrobiota bacterium]